jgi:hypothetical protein
MTSGRAGHGKNMNMLQVIPGLAFAGLIGARAIAASITDGEPSVRVQPAAPPQTQPFNVHEVRLFDGLFKTDQDIAAKYLRSLEPDQLLANFGKEAEKSVPESFGAALSDWSAFSENGAQADVVVDSTRPLDEQHTQSLRLTVKQSVGRGGMVNSASNGMGFKSEAWYDFTFYARTETNRHFGLTVSLENEDGRTICARATIPEVGGEWKKYTLALNTQRAAAKGRIVITMTEPGMIWLNTISLLPRKTGVP